MKRRSGQIDSYITRDGSVIRELLHPSRDPILNQSIAEASVAPGVTTHLHRHHQSEEVYYVLRGAGEMRLDDRCFSIAPGDTILIPPGTPHQLHNNGSEALVILCCCSPAYYHQDTQLLDECN
ncbi:MAG: cupin domain-containing protein [gamma proteobacterium symbiont of Phacoides pectinatus]